MLKNLSHFTIVGLILLFKTYAFEPYPFILDSVEYLGMGNASVAIAKGGDALFLNPASLDTAWEKRGKNLCLFNMTLEIDKDIGLAQDYLDRVLDISDDDDNAQILKILGDFDYLSLMGKISNFSHYNSRQGTLGFLVQGGGILRIYNDKGIAKMELLNAMDYSLAWGKAYDKITTVINHNQIDINYGLTTKYILRQAFVDLANPGQWLVASMEDFYDSALEDRYLLQTESRLALDLGAIGSFRNRNKSSVGIHIVDALSTKYPSSFGKIRPNFRLGAATYPYYRAMGVDELCLSMDVDRLFDNVPTIRKMHCGMQWKTNPWATYRLGLNGKHPTLGASWQAGSSFLLSYANYAHEYDGPNKEIFHNRNHVFTAKLTF